MWIVLIFAIAVFGANGFVSSHNSARIGHSSTSPLFGLFDKVSWIGERQIIKANHCSDSHDVSLLVL
jgi:hypothetical protein